MNGTGRPAAGSRSPRHGWEKFRPGILVDIDPVETRIVMGPERLEFRLPTNTLPPGLEPGQSVWFAVSEEGLTPLWWESLERDLRVDGEGRRGWRLRPSEPKEERGLMSRAHNVQAPSRVRIQSLA